MMLFSLVHKLLVKILFWREISIERSMLGSMSDELLKDIGISRLEALHEARRPFWDTSSFKELARPNRQIPY